MKYRFAGPDDAEKIATLHASSWRRVYRGNFHDAFLDGDVYLERNRAWAERLSNPEVNQFVCVAEDRGNICGFICAFGDHDSKWGSYIDNLHVDIGCQGAGVGRKLMSEAGTWLFRNFPSRGIYLIVWESNPAKVFYEKLGGRHTGVFDEDNPGGGSGRYIRIAWDNPEAIIR